MEINSLDRLSQHYQLTKKVYPDPDDKEALLKVMDKEIIPYVQYLWDGGYETFTSCQGGKGHSFPKPIVGVSFGIAPAEFGPFRDKLTEYLKKKYPRFSINYKAAYGPTAWWQAVYIEF
jgi:hypothetical protein